MADKNGNKTGGRVAGVPNKRNHEIAELAKEHGADPALFLIKLMKGDLRDFGYAFPEDEIYNPEEDLEGENLVLDKAMFAMLPKHMVPLETRKEAAKELMPYLYGKRKPVDSEGNDKGDPLSDLLNAVRPQ